MKSIANNHLLVCIEVYCTDVFLLQTCIFVKYTKACCSYVWTEWLSGCLMSLILTTEQTIIGILNMQFNM